MQQNYLVACLFILVGLFSNPVRSQQDPHISLYRFHMNMINPAVSGIKDTPMLNMTFRSQWQEFEDAPETQVISFGTPTKGERIGVGVNVIHDKTFVEEQTNIFGSFSYRLPMTKELDLFLGLQAGTNGYSVNAQNLRVYGLPQGEIDPNLINFSRFNPNVGVGAYLRHENYFFSISAPKILATKRFKEIDGLFTTAADRVHYYASGGYFIELNNQWEFVPSFLARYVNFAPFLFSANATFSYKRIIDFGLEYSFSSGIGGNMMVDTGGTFSFGYAYVTSMHPQINQFSKGTHEVVLRIKLGQEINNRTGDELARVTEDRNERRIGTRNRENNVQRTRNN